MSFSENFLWGGAVAAHQLEGGYREGGKGLSVADVMTAGAHGVPRRITDGVIEGERYPNHDGIDFYHTYRDDIKLFAETCFRCFRDKVTYWMTFNEINNQMNTANDLFAWVNSGMRPSTLEDPERAMYQAAHYEFVASARAVALGHEINPGFRIGCMVAAGPVYPASPRPADVLLANDAMHNTLFFSDVMARGSYPGYARALFARRGWDLDITSDDLEALSAGCVDYVGFSYYMSHTVDSAAAADVSTSVENSDAHMVPNPFLKATEWNRTIDPEGLRYMLKVFDERYGKPQFVVENGIGIIETLDGEGTVADDARIDYLGSHIAQMKRAVEEDGGATRHKVDISEALDRKSVV